jgi:hypothetical protein
MILTALEKMQAVSVMVTLADIVIVMALLLPAALTFLVMRRRQKVTVKASNVSWRRLREIVRKRDGQRCYYCGAIASNGHVDHLVPLSRNGTDNLSNLAWACQSCNTAKGSMTADEFLAVKYQKVSTEQVDEVEPEQPVEFSPALAPGQEPSRELAVLMRMWFTEGVSKNEICRRAWGYKDGTVWQILDRVLAENL